MKEEILSIASDLREGFITANDAKELLLTLFDATDGFKKDKKEHLCWANQDIYHKCMICGAIVK